MTTDKDFRRDLVVLGGSAGAIEALREIIGGLPFDLPAAVLVVVHMPARDPSRLAQVLDRCGPLPVTAAVHDAKLEPGHIYVAVPGRHLLVRDGRMLLSTAPKQNRTRPSIDALFRSAARWYGQNTVAVLLSGNLDDGAVGLAAVEAAGGACVVQDPDDALHPSMPDAGLAVVPQAEMLPVKTMAYGIQALLAERVEPVALPLDPDLVREAEMAEDYTQNSTERQPGRPITLSCPDCTGAMTIVESAGVMHYICHTGHIWSPQSLLAAQREKVEQAMWTALSILDEQARVYDTLSHSRSSAALPRRHQQAAAEEIRQAAETIREHFPEAMLDD